MDGARRKAIGLVARCGVFGVLMATGLITPGMARAARNAAAFEAGSLAAVLAALGGGNATAAGEVELVLPDIADNGASVPITLASRLPGTTQIALMVERNRNVLAAVYRFAAGTQPELQTRIKMAESSDVVALAQVGGQFRLSRRHVRVTLGGCAPDGPSPAAESRTPAPTRIRAVTRDGVTEVRVLMTHVMETGQRKDPSGALVPAHHITECQVAHNGRVVLSADFGPSISANPYLSFRFQGGAKGDKLAVSWVDNLGQRRSDEVDIA